MRANEIMTGDYFRIAQTSKIIKIVAVDEPSGSVDYFDGDAGGVLTIGVEKIEPIPLTKDILEKNGFECEQMEFSRAIWNTYRIAYGLYIAICGDMRVCGYYVGQLNNSDYIQNVLKIDYVHQLQHTLRLYGIDKEIVL